MVTAAALIEYNVFCLLCYLAPANISPSQSILCSLNVANLSLKEMGGQVTVNLTLPAGFSSTASVLSYEQLGPGQTAQNQFSIYTQFIIFFQSCYFTKKLGLTVSNDVELFVEVAYNITLCFRGKPIEYLWILEEQTAQNNTIDMQRYATSTLRVTPIYDPNAPALDALFITGPHVSREEYLTWKFIFNLFGLEFNIWGKEKVARRK